MYSDKLAEDEITMTDPLRYIHETTVHQLGRAVEDIESGDGLVIDFDYDQEVDDYIEDMGGVSVSRSTERTVTLELTYLLPE